MDDKASGLPAFSIIVPTFQRRELVCGMLQAIDSIVYPGPADITVVIDGSTDGSARALADLRLRRPLRIIGQANEGAAAARNRGAREAGGDILLFLDDDMFCQADILDAFARAFAKGADAAIGHVPVCPATPSGMLRDCVSAWADERARHLAQSGVRHFSDILSGQLAIRRSVFEQIGGFDADFTRGGRYGNEDHDLGMRLLASHEVAFVPDAISHQRYAITPEQNLAQSRATAAADLLFVRKHPGRGHGLLAMRDRERSPTRLLKRTLARLPGGEWMLSRIACALARHGYGYSNLSDHIIIRLFETAREVSYWSAYGAPDRTRDG